MRFLIIFIFLCFNSLASEIPDIKNMTITKDLKKYDSLTFLDEKNTELNLDNYKGSIILLNFWATWCAPCKEEMPSLDRIQKNEKLSNLKIFPINIGQENIRKVKKFYKDLGIQNLGLYYDSPETLAKKLSLRGIPTSILFNKNGEELARIVGSIDFENKNFIDWLRSYN